MNQYVNDFQVPGGDQRQLLCCKMAVLTPAQRPWSTQFQPMKALLKHESLGSQASADRVLQVPGLAPGGRCRGDAMVAALRAPGLAENGRRGPGFLLCMDTAGFTSGELPQR